jgi:hypothetical protein
MENQIVLSMTSVLTIIGGFGLILGWFYKLIAKKFEGVDKKFDAVDRKFDKIDGDIKDIRADIKDLGSIVTAFEKNTEHRLTVLEMEAKNTNQRLSNIEGYLVPKKVFRFEKAPEEESKEN